MSTWLSWLVGTNPVTSYTKLGFAARSRGFDPRDLAAKPKQRVVLVTGANSGIGFVVARELAARGDRVFMICRSLERGHAAKKRIDGDVQVARLDVSDLDDVRAFAQSFKEPVDVLVHSAAVLPAERSFTKQGLETTLATNLVGPYLLTSLLEPQLKRSADPRLILITSGGMFPRKLDVATLHHDKGPFDGVTAYADTKRALVELGEHWGEKLSGAVTVSSMHPGWADTPGVETSLPTFHRLTKWMLRTPEEGADTAVWLALKDGLPSGRLWFDREEISPFPLPWTKTPAGEREKLIGFLESAGVR